MKILVLGGAFGDEGKGGAEGAILLNNYYLEKGQKYGFVVRYHGGANAGETWINPGGIVVFSHQVPVGIGMDGLYAAFLSGGAILPKDPPEYKPKEYRPAGLMEEIKDLREKGIRVDKTNFGISGRNQVVLLHHLMEETDAEAAKGKTGFGTTLRGISTMYAAAAYKQGMTFAEFVGDNFVPILRDRILPAVHIKFGGKYDIPLDRYVREYEELREYLSEFLVPEADLMRRINRPETNVLQAGCQSIGLDVYNGANRHSSSSVTTRPPLNTDITLALFKFPQSEVGDRRFTHDGAWVTYDNKVSEVMRGERGDLGGEYGTTSGRPRKLDFNDTVLYRHNILVGKVNRVGLTKMDEMPKFVANFGTHGSIPICTAYKYRDSTLTDLPDDSQVLEKCEPVYGEWRVGRDFLDPKRLSRIKLFSELTENSLDSLRRLQDHLGGEVKIDILSRGPGSDEKIFRDIEL
ncbi:MAG: adenylosuccinate synthetase [Candidatus Aenigmarchaeota archaeon]|nr:adenylosuccinate synthetase [Candidatus Aenigmarchaeota archaeon]